THVPTTLTDAALASHKFLITGNVANQNIGYIALALKKGCELLAGVSQSRDGSRLDLFQQQVLVEKFQQGQPMLRSRAYAQTLYRLPPPSVTIDVRSVDLEI